MVSWIAAQHRNETLGLGSENAKPPYLLSLVHKILQAHRPGSLWRELCDDGHGKICSGIRVASAITLMADTHHRITDQQTSTAD